MAGIIFDDIFNITHVNLEGNFYPISRLRAHSETLEMDLVLDFNSWIYPLKVGDKIHLVVATTLFRDGRVCSHVLDVLNPTDNLANDFEYVMYGKVVAITATNFANPRISTYMSFGGSMVKLSGNFNNMAGFDFDRNFFLVMKKLEP